MYIKSIDNPNGNGRISLVESSASTAEYSGIEWDRERAVESPKGVIINYSESKKTPESEGKTIGKLRKNHYTYIIGDNGCGKTTLLRKIQKVVIKEKKNKVVFIQNSAYSHYYEYSYNSIVFGVSTSILYCIANGSFENLDKQFLNYSQDKLRLRVIIDYLHIAQMVRGLDLELPDSFSDHSKGEQERLVDFLNWCVTPSNFSLIYNESLYHYSDPTTIYNDYLNSKEKLYKYVLKVEDIDKGLARILLFLQHTHFGNIEFLIEEMPVDEALSTGEQMMIKMVAFLSDVSLVQKENLVILYDEPETFLHPKWQQQFPVIFRQIVEETFGISDSHIIITTHSPLIIMNAKKMEFANVSVLKFFKEDDTWKNEFVTNVSSYCVEQLMMDQFDVTYRDKNAAELYCSDTDPADAIGKASEIKKRISELYNKIVGTR